MLANTARTRFALAYREARLLVKSQVNRAGSRTIAGSARDRRFCALLADKYVGARAVEAAWDALDDDRGYRRAASCDLIRLRLFRFDTHARRETYGRLLLVALMDARRRRIAARADR